MQNLEQKVDMMLHNQDDIQRSIRNIKQVEIDMLKIQGDILRTQYKMQEEIYALKESQDTIQSDICDLKENQKKMQEDIESLDKKIDINYEKLDKKIDKNVKDTSEIFQEICARLDENNNSNSKLAIV